NSSKYSSYASFKYIPSQNPQGGIVVLWHWQRWLFSSMYSSENSSNVSFFSLIYATSLSVSDFVSMRSCLSCFDTIKLINCESTSIKSVTDSALSTNIGACTLLNSDNVLMMSKPTFILAALFKSVPYGTPL